MAQEAPLRNIPPLAFAEIDAGLQVLLAPTVERLGYFGEFFQYAGHAPGVLQGFMQYSGALKQALPDDLNETIALTVCTALDFAYERIQHERLSERLGFALDWIAALVGRGEDSVLTEAQHRARALALAVLGGEPERARAAIDDLARETSAALALAALFQVTRFRDVCMIGRLFAMRLPVPSIFAEQPLQDPR